MSLAELDEEALTKCLPTIDSRDLVMGIRYLNPLDQKTLLDRIGGILGMEYAEILRLAVLQD